MKSNSESALSRNKETISNVTRKLMESLILAHNERRRYDLQMQVGREVVFPVANGLSVISRRKVKMISSHHAPYALGNTRATMDRTKDGNPTRSEQLDRSSSFLTHVGLWGDMRQTKGKERDGVSLTFDIVGSFRGPTQRVISSVVEHALDNCAIVPGL
ncbi:hypothetical protein KIW84_044778 [Lathyrus oleraceus]|uniref:Uncharacterized protein n=1 Tax=Pisum sativum TaxID=3888 RepID=A0A9D4XIK7_PEA|nr:hypothetical protein KIW84_044778 [Pisum sativum]